MTKLAIVDALTHLDARKPFLVVSPNYIASSAKGRECFTTWFVSDRSPILMSLGELAQMETGWRAYPNFSRLLSLIQFSSLIARETRKLRLGGSSRKANSSLICSFKVLTNTPYKASSFRCPSATQVQKSTEQSVTLLFPCHKLNRVFGLFPLKSS